MKLRAETVSRVHAYWGAWQARRPAPADVSIVAIGPERYIRAPDRLLPRLVAAAPADLEALVAALGDDAADVVGEARLAYADEGTRRRVANGAVTGVDDHDAGLAALEVGADPGEWRESSVDEPCSHRFGVAREGSLVAVATLQVWDGALGQIGVFTAARARGVGHAVAAGAAAVEQALASGWVPQWRSRIGNEASARVAVKLGFVEVGRQMTVRVRELSGAGRLVAVPEAERSPGWLLDEASHAGRENLDPEHVARYDRKEDADAGAEVRLLLDLGMDAASTVVDFGAGTGQFALAVGPFCRRVVAVDVSPVMLASLRSAVGALGEASVECVEAGLLTYEHGGAPVDFAYCRYALHHLPDFWKAIALTRINTLLRPGGVLRLWDVVYGFDPADAPARLEAWCATGGEHIGTAWTRSELEEHVRDEHSTFTWLLEEMIVRAGFVIEVAAYSDDQLSAKYVLRKPRLAE